MKRLRVTPVLALGLLVATAASGHVPDSLEDKLEVEAPYRSTALYGEFETGEEVFTVVLDYSERAFSMPVEMLVPVRDEWEDHRPMFAVVGPGLPPPNAVTEALLPREVPEGMGVFLEQNSDDERAEFYEPFSDTNFWTSEPTALIFDEGVHEVWIFSPAGTTGKFTFGFGVEEEFELEDYVRLATAGDEFSDDGGD